ncbi:hypothetical protein N24_0095 [Corynebacterium suranareeae]|uniref:Uncharacterized protein n=1 Tax=Corynebacterium suranareeae TaxID=2506452 RepID=A0A160PL04_9CORY|nr:hypothetical protein N24_0095 [Corynebacterium suranareeae]
MNFIFPAYGRRHKRPVSLNAPFKGDSEPIDGSDSWTNSS